MIECLSRASLSRIVQCLQVRQKLAQVKRLSGAPLYGRLLALPTCIRLGWKGLPGANTLSLLPKFLTYGCKKFNIVPEKGRLTTVDLLVLTS